MGKERKKRNRIPALRELVLRYYEHDVARDSAALTYYLLFAIFPLLIFLSMLLGALALDVEETMAAAERIIPPELAGVMRSYLEYVSGNNSPQLMWFSLIFSIWFPMRATGCLMHSMRKAYGFDTPVSIWKSQLNTLLFAVGLIVTIAVSALASVVGKRAVTFIERLITVPDGLATAWIYLRFALMALVVALLLTALHMLSLGKRLRLRQVLPGVAASVAAWVLVSLAFSFYVEQFARYTELYGSIATIVVSLLWMYMSGSVLILGAELNGVLEGRSIRRHGTGERKRGVI